VTPFATTYTPTIYVPGRRRETLAIDTKSKGLHPLRIEHVDWSHTLGGHQLGLHLLGDLVEDFSGS
jgi:hypothetical protein